jgi:hypothetical protein
MLSPASAPTASLRLSDTRAEQLYRGSIEARLQKQERVALWCEAVIDLDRDMSWLNDSTHVAARNALDLQSSESLITA